MGDVAKPLEFDSFSESEEKKEEPPVGDDQGDLDAEGESPKEVDLDLPKNAPPKADEYEWVWKVRSAVVCICYALLTPAHSIARARNIETYILPLTCIYTRAFIVGMS